MWGKKRLEWIYAICIGGSIVKIGKTTVGLAGRFGSYNTGKKAYRKSGTCSTTNYNIYQSLFDMLNLGYDVEIYGYELPKAEMIFGYVGGDAVKGIAQCSAYYETFFIKKFIAHFGHPPFFCKNCDDPEGSDVIREVKTIKIRDIPEGLFTIQDLAVKNNICYITARNFILFKMQAKEIIHINGKRPMVFQLVKNSTVG